MTRDEREPTPTRAAGDRGGDYGANPGVLLAFLAAMVGAGAVTAGLPWTMGDVSGVVLFLSIALGLGLAAGRGDGLGWDAGRGVLLLAFALRGLAAIAQRLYPLPALYGADAAIYDAGGWAIAQAWLSGADAAVEYISFNVAAYERLAAGVYLAVGRSALTMQVVAALMGSLAVYYAWRSARELIGEHRAGALALLLAVWPSHILWTSQNLRDPWAFFFISRMVWSGILWLKYSRTAEWTKAVCFAALLGVFRLSAAVPMGAVLLAMSAYVAWRAMTWRIRLPLVIFALGGLLFAWWVAADADAASGIAVWSPAGLSRIRQGLATGGSAFFPELSYDSWLDVLEFVPIGVVYVLFAPFPWDVENAAQVGSGLENAVLYVLVAIGLLGHRGLGVLRQRQGAFVGLVVLIGVSMLAVIEGNVGTAYRHKMQFLPYLLMLVAAGGPVPGDAAWRDAEPLAGRAPARAAV